MRRPTGPVAKVVFLGHRRRRQPATVAEMEAMVQEEWDRIPQESINQLIEKQEHWVDVFM